MIGKIMAAIIIVSLLSMGAIFAYDMNLNREEAVVIRCHEATDQETFVYGTSIHRHVMNDVPFVKRGIAILPDGKYQLIAGAGTGFVDDCKLV